MASIGSSMPEFSLITLISDSSRPSPGILQLNIHQGIKESARVKFNSQIGSVALKGREENREATHSATAAQDRSHVGSSTDPLYGKKEFGKLAAKLKTLFVEEPTVRSTGRMATQLMDSTIPTLINQLGIGIFPARVQNAIPAACELR